MLANGRRGRDDGKAGRFVGGGGVRANGDVGLGRDIVGDVGDVSSEEDSDDDDDDEEESAEGLSGDKRRTALEREYGCWIAIVIFDVG